MAPKAHGGQAKHSRREDCKTTGGTQPKRDVGCLVEAEWERPRDSLAILSGTCPARGWRSIKGLSAHSPLTLWHAGEAGGFLGSGERLAGCERWGRGQ
jgi:hypothetical protein